MTRGRQPFGFAGRPEKDEPAAIFARIPRAEAEKLDRAAFALRRPKQEILAELVARYLPLDVAEEDWTVGRAGFRAAETPEVLTPEQAAELLQVEVETILTLAAAGGLPARKLGEEWRFSRRGLLEWLARSS